MDFVEIVQLLLKHPDIDVNFQNNKGFTPLIRAAKDGKKEIVELLLKHPNVDTNVQDNEGRTALFYAIYFGYKEIVKLILKLSNNIDINIQEKDG
ncbi:ankyrin, partial [Anaeromyces robustus]